MASVQVYKSRGIEYVRIVESFRDPITKKPKTKTIKNLGRKDVLEQDNPNFIQNLKNELQAKRDKQENIQRKEVQNYLSEILETNSVEAAKLQNYGYLVYKKIWKELNLDYFFDYRQKADSKIDFSIKDACFNLTMLRLLMPSSKLKAFENQDKLFDLKEVPIHQMYRTLEFLFKQKDNLQKYLHKKVCEMTDRDLSVCFYDVTTMFFESVEQDALKRFGFSKDNKVNNVQVVLGLLIDKNGIPVYYDLFPGNTSDFRTLEPILEKLKKDFNVKKMILTADRGLNSKRNLAILRRHGYDYIIAYKIRTATKDIKEMVIDKSSYKRLNDDLSFKETVLNQRVSVDGIKEEFIDRFLLTYSLKRAKKDRQDRMRLVEKAIKLSESKSMMKSEMKKGGKNIFNCL
ncbi:IS1634 family transposase [Helcococcus kunzii]|uniref:IS1634 family transposase n=1 Tax=Helcococcus kunzii TaxID=40091 RepID=UPI0024AD73F6|nr:IS1634 family transposase [Helcococcus kunzii]